MKKLLISLFSFILILSGGFFSAQLFSAEANDSYTIFEIENGQDLVTKLSTETIYDSPFNVIRLEKDIDMTDVDTTPISKVNKAFLGTFDGNGYSISNLTLSSETQYYGLIPKAKGAIIQNVKFTGTVAFNIGETNTKEVFAGVLVGDGENVAFTNCEFDGGTENINQINLEVYSDFNFGFLAGRLKGNPLATASGNRANIKDCVNYYKIAVAINKSANINIGGLVGNVYNGYFLNTLNMGNFALTNNVLEGDNSLKIHVGGVVGAIGGSGTNIRNSCFGGLMTFNNDISNLNLKCGAIFGGALASGVNTSNINFDYYLDSTLKIAGDEYVESSENLKCVEAINKTFLSNAENFDKQTAPFDFGKVWSLSESKFKLQNFMIFTFNFKTVLNKTIESAKFVVGESVQLDSHSERYGKPVRIDVKFKSEYVGYYKMNGMSLSNIEFDMNNASVSQLTNERGQVKGYTIYVEANATTSGSYSFDIQSVTYNCIATISEDAKTLGQGGVRIADNNITTPTSEMSIQFTYNSAVKKIVAEGASGSVYAFDTWKLYYKGEDGKFLTEEVPFANATDSTLSISFGAAPFDREFKLVAFFTDENAILVDFGDLSNSRIKSIKFSGVDYEGQPIAVSPNHAKNLEITVSSGFKLNVKAFEDAIKKLYGEEYNTDTLIISDPEVDEEGNTTYKFSINMKYIDEPGTELKFNFQVDEDDSKNKNNLLWLYIAIPCAGVLLIGIIIFIIIRRRRGGGKGGKNMKAVKTKAKKESYKNYY